METVVIGLAGWLIGSVIFGIGLGKYLKVRGGERC